MRLPENSLSRDNIARIESVKIGIAGCGGLGSNCAVNLVRCGFTRLKIIDFDVVEDSNLNRQFFFFDQIGMPKTEALAVNLKRINPDINIEAIQGKITSRNAKELFIGCDIAAECLDGAGDKSMLVSSLSGSVKFMVSASGIAGFGDSDRIRVNRLGKDVVVMGDLKTGTETVPAFSPAVNIAAAKQADAILEYALKGAVA